MDLLGESFAILAFGAKRRGTGDIDITTNIEPVIGAFEQARKETGLPVEVSTVGVYDAPSEYASREQRLDISGLSRLQVFVPEKHDWALMKILRSLEKDVMDVVEVRGKIGLDKLVLMGRFLDEMTHVIGHPRTIVQDFLSAIRELYGDNEAVKAENAIKAHRGWEQKLGEAAYPG